MNKVEVYGFVGWIATYVWIFAWFIWAFVPHDYIRNQLGISFIPSRYWVLALPTYGMAVFVVAHAVYWGMALWNTPPLYSKCLIQDDSAMVTVRVEGEEQFDIPSAHDLPLSYVNDRLYFSNRKRN
jgi:phosphatidylinositol glycan class P protein